MSHSRFSPSGAHRWMPCPGSAILEQGIQDTSSEYANEGTKAHELAAAWLNGEVESDDALNNEMGRHIVGYGRRVYDLVESDPTVQGELLVEQKLDFSEWINVAPEEGFGTADAVILLLDEIILIDFKYGMGVKIDAEDNPQMLLYALGALASFEQMGIFKRVRMIIDQPRLGHVSEAVATVEQLKEFAARVLASVQLIQAAKNMDADSLEANGYLNPGEDQCRWCKARASCPALSASVSQATGVDFDDLTSSADEPKNVSSEWLGRAMAAIPMVEDWCKAIRAEVEGRLLAGKPVDGWKLVEGKRGSRRWSDEQKAEELFKAFRWKKEEIFDMKLISPTTAEKRLAENPKQWERAQALITQAEGRPSVAPQSDKRPAISMATVADDFETLV